MLGCANDSSSFKEGSAFLSLLHAEDFPSSCSLSSGVVLIPVSSIVVSRVVASANVVVLWVSKVSMSNGRFFTFSPSHACLMLSCDLGSSLSVVCVPLIGSVHRCGRVLLPGL